MICYVKSGYSPKPISLFFIHILQLYPRELVGSVNLWNGTPSTHHVVVSSTWLWSMRTAPFNFGILGSYDLSMTSQSLSFSLSLLIRFCFDGDHCLRHWEGDNYEQDKGSCDFYRSWSWGYKFHCFHRVNRGQKCLEKKEASNRGEMEIVAEPEAIAHQNRSSWLIVSTTSTSKAEQCQAHNLHSINVSYY